MTATKTRLPDDRVGKTQHFTILFRNDSTNPPSIEEVDGYIQSGTYENGELGEVFLKIGKEGDEKAIYDQLAMSWSVALQHGISVNAVLEKHVATRFEPSGAVKGVEGIARCTSPVDLVARWLLGRYGKERAT